jgi:phenylalanyl-tRNA synthetase beta chain
MVTDAPDLALERKRKISDLLVANGYQEIITYTFVSDKCNTESNSLRLLNPISADFSTMRGSLLPGLLNTICYNQSHKEERMRFFEIGLCFLKNESKELTQPLRLAGAVVGSVNPKQWGENSQDADIFAIKNDIENIFKAIDKTAILEFRSDQVKMLHPGCTACIYYKNLPVGYLGKIHPNIQNSLEINKAVYLFEIDLSFLESKIDLKFKNISKFPAIERDISLVITKDIKWADIKSKIWDIGANSILKDVKLFDIYDGEGIATGYMSLALHMVFQDISRTLVEEEVEVLLQRIIVNLEQNFNAKLRG